MLFTAFRVGVDHLLRIEQCDIQTVFETMTEFSTVFETMTEVIVFSDYALGRDS